MPRAWPACAILALVLCGAAPPAYAQEIAPGAEENRERGAAPSQRTEIRPYIEASQALVWQFEPVDETVTYTQLAAGIDASIVGRNNGGTISLRYERNFAWGNSRADGDTLTGIARGYASIVPRVLTLEAGALASRTSIDGVGTAITPGIGNDLTNQVYAIYAGPNVATRAGPVEVAANYRIGYARVESSDPVVGITPAADIFDESVTHSASLRAGTRPGDPLPVGVGAGAGYFQEDVENLDQRIRDAFVRGDVTVPVTPTLAFVAGAGLEDVEISSRDALRDEEGVPIIGPDGRFITDRSSPRRIAYEADGLIWDVGVVWRPSRRTALEAHFGRRYDSDTFYGTFAWQPDRRSSVNVGVYDGIAGFGGRLTNALSVLPSDFDIIRDPVTGQITGCVGPQGASCLDALLLGSVRSAAFRSRGVTANYSRQVGRLTASFGAGYDNRRFIAASDSVLAPANGITDESWYLAAGLAGPLGPRGRFGANAYYTWFDSGVDAAGDVTALGVTGVYTRQLYTNLSARAAIALSRLDSSLTAADVSTATVLVGVRYDF